MSESGVDETSVLRVDVAICIDGEALSRLRPVVRHLCVGLVDNSAQVRVVTSSPDAASLASLGPVQLMVHPILAWPMRRSRLRKIVDFLSPQPPSIIYAISRGSYHLGDRLSQTFDTDLVVQLSSAADLDALGNQVGTRIAHRIASSEPLFSALMEREEATIENSTLIRPGVLRGSELSCFTEPHRVPSIVCATRLEKRYGLDVVIEAIRVVRDNGHPLLAFFAETGPAEPTLRKLVHDRKLSANVTFARPTGEPTEILRGADILVVPPGDEAISARPLQAMANGTAVVCFEPGVADYFHDGRTAVVCKERTAAALARSIETLLLDQEFARQMATNARQYVTEHHPMSGMAERTVAVFRQLVLRRQTIPMPR